jgi:hypothetical protein
MIGAVVLHDVEHRDPVMGRRPQRARAEHEVAVTAERERETGKRRADRSRQRVADASAARKTVAWINASLSLGVSWGSSSIRRSIANSPIGPERSFATAIWSYAFGRKTKSGGRGDEVASEASRNGPDASAGDDLCFWRRRPCGFECLMGGP